MARPYLSSSIAHSHHVLAHSLSSSSHSISLSSKKSMITCTSAGHHVVQVFLVCSYLSNKWSLLRNQNKYSVRPVAVLHKINQINHAHLRLWYATVVLNLSSDYTALYSTIWLMQNLHRQYHSLQVHLATCRKLKPSGAVSFQLYKSTHCDLTSKKK